MHVREVRPNGCDRSDRILLFDVGVKRVVHGGNVGVPDRGDMRGQIGHCVDKITLEPVDCLEGDRNPMLAGDLAGSPMKIDGAAPLVLGWRLAGKMAERRVQWSAHDLRAQRRATFNDPFDMLQRRCALLGRRANRVHVHAWNNSNPRRLEVEAFQMVAELGVM